MSLSFNGARTSDVDGLTITGLSVQGTTRNITVANSRSPGRPWCAPAASRTRTSCSTATRREHQRGLAAASVRGPAARLHGGSRASGVTIRNSVCGRAADADGISDRRQRRPGARQRVHRDQAGQRRCTRTRCSSTAARNTVIRGNYFHDFSVAIMASGRRQQRADHRRQRVHRRRLPAGGAARRATRARSSCTTWSRTCDVHMDAKSENPGRRAATA